MKWRPFLPDVWDMGRGWREVRHWHEPCFEFPLLHASLFIDVASGDCVFAVHTRSQHLASWPAWHPVHWPDNYEEVRAAVAKFVRRAVERVSASREAASIEGRNFESSHPAIMEYLTLAVNDDQTPRETSMLCVFVEDGLVKLAVQDRQEGCSLWVTAPSIPEALAAAETKLVTGQGEWRQSRQQARSSRQKR